MKKLFGILFTLLLSFSFTSCNFWTDADLVIRRIRDHLDLPLDSTSNTYQYKWYILKYDDAYVTAGTNLSIKLTGIPYKDLPAFHIYLAEYKDPNLTSYAYAQSVEDDDSYVAADSEWVTISDEIDLFSSASQGQELTAEQDITFNADVIDNAKVVLLLYVNPEQLSDDYFDYYDELLAQAQEEALAKAQAKADKYNEKENLSEDDEDYHTYDEYYDDIYEDLVDEIGEKRLIINDVKLRLELKYY
ncbi:MAG: hypothetical protein K5866_01960 [Treponema sp.]|nr:hypothetical protein [Treponema sp.]